MLSVLSCLFHDYFCLHDSSNSLCLILPPSCVSCVHFNQNTKWQTLWWKTEKTYVYVRVTNESQDLISKSLDPLHKPVVLESEKKQTNNNLLFWDPSRELVIDNRKGAKGRPGFIGMSFGPLRCHTPPGVRRNPTKERQIKLGWHGEGACLSVTPAGYRWLVIGNTGTFGTS